MFRKKFCAQSRIFFLLSLSGCLSFEHSNPLAPTLEEHQSSHEVGLQTVLVEEMPFLNMSYQYRSYFLKEIDYGLSFSLFNVSSDIKWFLGSLDMIDCGLSFQIGSPFLGYDHSYVFFKPMLHLSSQVYKQEYSLFLTYFDPYIRIRPFHDTRSFRPGVLIGFVWDFGQKIGVEYSLESDGFFIYQGVGFSFSW